MAISKQTPEVKAAIVESVRNGAYAKHAALSADVSESTLHNWQRDDVEFAAAIERARADAQIAMVSVIRGAALDDWKAAAWYLARAGEGFIERTATEHSGGVTLANLREILQGAEQ